jgi:hypothetical protein
LAAAQSWWQYFTRRELLRRRHVMLAETQAADELLQQVREKLRQIEEQGGAKYPGLSREARRTLNLTAIACAQVLALRLTPPVLLERAAEAMSRSEPRIVGSNDAAVCLAAMQEIARAKAAMAQNAQAIRTEVRRLVDQLAAAVVFRKQTDTTPTADTTHAALKAALATPEIMTWDVLSQDLWCVSDLLYAEGD